MKIEITEKFLETVGGNGLLGKIVKELPAFEAKSGEEITLLCPFTSDDFRRKNNGPKQFIVNEYTLFYLLDDIFWLQNHGVKVKLEPKWADT